MITSEYSPNLIPCTKRIEVPGREREGGGGEEGI